MNEKNLVFVILAVLFFILMGIYWFIQTAWIYIIIILVSFIIIERLEDEIVKREKGKLKYLRKSSRILVLLFSALLGAILSLILEIIFKDSFSIWEASIMNFLVLFLAYFFIKDWKP